MHREGEAENNSTIPSSSASHFPNRQGPDAVAPRSVLWLDTLPSEMVRSTSALEPLLFETSSSVSALSSSELPKRRANRVISVHHADESEGGPSSSLFKGVPEFDAEPIVPSHSNVDLSLAMENHAVLRSMMIKHLGVHRSPWDSFVSELAAPGEVGCLSREDAEKLCAICPTVRWLSGLVD